MAMFDIATLVDRTGGPSELQYDGQVLKFTTASPEQHVPREVAEFIFRSTQQHIWSNEQGYVCRYGLKDGPAALLDALGAEALETSPLTIDTTRVEGWETDGNLLPGRRQVIDASMDRRLAVDRRDFARQSEAVGGTFTRER